MGKCRKIRFLFCAGKVSSGKVSLEKCRWENVGWENVPMGNCRLGKCHGTDLPTFECMSIVPLFLSLFGQRHAKIRETKN